VRLGGGSGRGRHEPSWHPHAAPRELGCPRFACLCAVAPARPPAHQARKRRRDEPDASCLGPIVPAATPHLLDRRRRPRTGRSPRCGGDKHHVSRRPRTPRGTGGGAVGAARLAADGAEPGCPLLPGPSALRVAAPPAHAARAGRRCRGGCTSRRRSGGDGAGHAWGCRRPCARGRASASSSAPRGPPLGPGPPPARPPRGPPLDLGPPTGRPPAASARSGGEHGRQAPSSVRRSWPLPMLIAFDTTELSATASSPSHVGGRAAHSLGKCPAPRSSTAGGVGREGAGVTYPRGALR